MFSQFAAGFPGFLLQAEMLPGENLRFCAAMLAAIDFFRANAHTHGQTYSTDMRLFQLYSDLLQGPSMSEGLYTLARFHPDTVVAQPAVQIELQTVQQDDSLLLVAVEPDTVAHERV